MEEGARYDKKRALSIKTVIILGAVTLAIVSLVGFGMWSYKNYTEAKKEIARLSSVEGQKELAKKELDSIRQKLGRHIILPQDEDPTIATVTDVEALKKTQAFFNNAQNGDKLIVYSGAKKAIIYSPERDILVNVGALVLDEGSPQVAGSSINESQTQPDQATETKTKK